MVDTSQSGLRTADRAERLAPPGWSGWAPLSGIAFPVLAPLIWVVTVSIILIRRPALARAA